MKKFREILSRPSVTVALLVLALALLGGSTLGGARAALTVESQDYKSHIETNSMDVALVENGLVVEGSDQLFTNLLKDEDGNVVDETVKIGKAYKENLAVTNRGALDEYVRVTLYKYWLKSEKEGGEKYPEMDSQWIELGIVEGNGWKKDDDTVTNTEERIVLYYTPILAAGETTPDFMKTISINEKAARIVTQQTDAHTITTTYVYEGKQFCLEVHVDGVQTHSAAQAKTSAWGVNK